MSVPGWRWQSPPGWPPPPEGWTPPPGWEPSPQWSAPPEGWVFWVPAAQPPAASRRDLVLETWFVQLAFLLPSVVSAIDTLAAHLAGSHPVSFFPTVVHGHPVENLILSVGSYLAVGAVVPLALLLLARSGHLGPPIGLPDRGWRRDLLPGLGIAAAGYATSLILAGPLSALLSSHKGLVAQLTVGRVPAYYLIYGLLVAAVTGITEETLVNGYLLTRLEQLGWKPGPAVLLSLVLRTSYHLYYGLGLVFTIPFGYFATRSFAKHRRLVRPIAAHFIYDAVLITFSVLTAAHG